MRATILVWVLWCAGAGCEVRDSERVACEERAIAAAVTGEIVVGKELLPGEKLTLPYVVAVLVRSNVLLKEVRVGGTSARLTEPTNRRWEVSLSRADLERNRAAGDEEAILRVVAYDLCNGEHAIDQAVVALGPDPGASVSDLALAVEYEPEGECAIPTGGQVTPLVRVTAAAESVGAKVTVAVSHGTLAGGGTSKELVLADAGDHAEATTFFLPPDEGATAVISASGEGAVAAPLALPVVEGPAIGAAPTAMLQRDVAYGFTVTTAGNLDSCLVEEAIAGSSTVTIVEPALGAITDVTTVREDPLSCDRLERVRMTVQFSAAAPEGAAVTVRCFDTYGRDGSQTFTVAPPP